MTVALPFGTWPSPFSAAMVAGAEIGLAEPRLDGGRAYWIEARPAEGGRHALMRREPGGRMVELTPAPFNARSLAHEYGGGAYAAAGAVVLAVDFACQRLHRLADGAPPRPLTPASGRRLRYADLAIDLPRRRVVAVREDHRGDGQPVNALVSVALEGGGDEGRVLWAGSDFVAGPCLSPDGGRLAWLAWDHPDMPWDATRLWLAKVGADGGLIDARAVAGGGEESLVQPQWSPSGALHVVSDRSGFWNLHRLEASGLRPLCPLDADFAGPAWAFGLSWYAFLGGDDILACYTRDGLWRLGRLDARSGALAPYDLPWTQLGGLRALHGKAVLRVAGPDRPAAIALLDPDTGGLELLKSAGELPVEARFLSRPQPIAFASEGGATAHAFHYPPTHPEARAPGGERPPLILRSHGGPTGAASSALDLEKQFWTSRGFAVLDVNYGGSSGFGRAYRKRLEGRWGEVDVADCVAAARHLVAAGQADPARLAIKGGSAGGYTTLCALTFTDAFRAGSSHYGIGDLEALARDTHKFESRYLDRLIGPWPQAREVYRARSPIHHVARLSCPVIFFQGLDDTIVPPNQAEAMVAALREKGLPVAYLAFVGEQHGFRRAETIVQVLEAERAFFCRVFGIAPAEPLAPLAIDNL